MESFTRIPNNIIDESLLNPYQFQLFSIIVRKTDGWCKVEDGISLSQFEKLVSFKKNKIVNTLKELEELDFIEKTRNYNDELKTFSYSTYKVSQRVVSENNKGSISHKQGVVSEKDKQKKLITKETNTLGILSFLNGNETLINIANDFISYRKQIKKPIKTDKPIKFYLKNLKELKEDGYDVKKCIEEMKSKEWQSITKDYVKNRNDLKANNQVFSGWSE